MKNEFVPYEEALALKELKQCRKCVNKPHFNPLNRSHILKSKPQNRGVFKKKILRRHKYLLSKINKNMNLLKTPHINNNKGCRVFIYIVESINKQLKRVFLTLLKNGVFYTKNFYHIINF